MDRDEIYQLLNKHGVSGAMIARALDVTPSAVVEVIRNGKGSKRIATAISTACEKPLKEIFPFYAEKEHEAKRKATTEQALTAKLAKYA